MTTPETTPAPTNVDLEALARRARGSYERARLRRAVAKVFPVAALVGLAVVVGADRWHTHAAAAAAVALGVVALWRGQELERGYRVGAWLGVLPLLGAHGARLLGGGCSLHGCSDWCMPACAAGGCLAGFVASTQLRGTGPTALGSAFGFIFLTGALGCACLGGGGILGLAAGLAAAGLVATPRYVTIR